MTPLVEQVRESVWSIPVPIPDNPLGHSFCYLVMSGDEVVLVDPGWDTDVGWDELRSGLRAAGTDVSEVTGVLVTHVHPDHHGLSARVRKASGAWVGMHAADADLLHTRWRQGSEDADLQWLHRCGVPDDWRGELQWRSHQLDRVLAMAEPDVLLEDGQRVGPDSSIEVVWTPGHSPGHLCFVVAGEQIVMTGDHVLPRISPNVGFGPFTPAPPLAGYVASLEAVARFDPLEVLPGHEFRFTGLAARTAELIEHHEERSAVLEGSVRQLGPTTIWTVAANAAWARGWDSLSVIARRLALAETAAHLADLREQGRLEAASGEIPIVWSAPSIRV